MANLSITANSVVPSTSAVKLNGKAGEAIAAGEIVYLTSTSNTYSLADANDNTKLPAAGIAGNSAGTGQALQVIVSDPSLTIGTHGVALGTPYFLSRTAGKACPLADLTTGDYTTAVFITKTTTTVAFGILAGGAAIP
jgi:hypothetical protein